MRRIQSMIIIAAHSYTNNESFLQEACGSLFSSSQKKKTLKTVEARS